MAVKRWPLVAAMIMGLATAASTNAQPQSEPLYKDARQPVERRVEDLLSRMTLDEKVAQLETIWESKAKLQTSSGQFSPELAAKNFPNGIGGFARPSDYRGVTQTNGAAGAAGVTVNRDARQTAEYINAAQHWAVEHTRLGIPILMHEEALHGYVARGATSFPQAIALASTWDPELVDARLLRGGARGARARRNARPRAGRGRRARSALGPHRGDLRRGSVPGEPDGPGCGPRLPGFDASPPGRQGVRHLEAFHRARCAGERDQRRPGACRRARASHRLLPAVRKRR